MTRGLPTALNPEMMPSSLAKMKRAALVPALLVTTKLLLLPLNTTPVGVPCWPPAPGTVKTNGMAPVPTLYSVVRPDPLSAIHHGDVGLEASPQALTRRGSTRSAGTAPSETRLCWV